MVLYLAGEEPEEAIAHGECYVRPGVEDVVFCFLRFPSGLSAHLHLSWLDPHKERRFTSSARGRMATFDDMAIEGKLTIYDKGFDEDVRTYGEYITRTGDIFSPRIPNVEPLRLECEHFVELRPDRRATALGRRQRPARGPRARAAPAVARSIGPRCGCRASLRSPPGPTWRPTRSSAPAPRSRPGAVIHSGARIGSGAAIGSGTVVHAGTQVGDDCVIEDLVVLGKRPRLRAGSSAAGGELSELVLETGVKVCCGAIVYAGARIGAGAIIGDQAQVRERCTIGERSVVGRGSAIDFGVSVGSRVLIQTDVYVTGGIASSRTTCSSRPGVMTTNDNTMGRHPRGEALRGATFRRACRVGGAAVIVPGVEIGEEAFVAAGAVVTRDVGEREVVMGVPGTGSTSSAGRGSARALALAPPGARSSLDTEREIGGRDGDLGRPFA